MSKGGSLDSDLHRMKQALRSHPKPTEEQKVDAVLVLLGFTDDPRELAEALRAADLMDYVPKAKARLAELRRQEAA